MCEPSRSCLFPFKSMTGPGKKDILQSRLSERDRLNLLAEAFHQLADEERSLFPFDAEEITQREHLQTEFGFQFVRQRLRFAGPDGETIAADRGPQLVRNALGDDFTTIDDGQGVAAFGFFHQMCGYQNRDAGFPAESFEVSPHFLPCAGIEAGARLIEEQDAGVVQESLGDFDPALQTAGESLHDLPGPIGDTETSECNGNARFQIRAAQTVEVSLMSEVLDDGQFAVEAGRLKGDAEETADGIRFGGYVAIADPDRAALDGEQCREESEEGRFASTIGSEESEDRFGLDAQVDTGEGRPITVAVFDSADLDRRYG